MSTGFWMILILGVVLGFPAGYAVRAAVGRRGRPVI